MEDGKVTIEIKNLLSKIEHHTLFKDYPIYFVGGTALSTYLDHRISYDIDFICDTKLPVNAINAFAFSIGATPVPDRAKASAFRINKGENLENYHLKYMVDGVKMEFSYFDDPLISVILEEATVEPYSAESHLAKLSLNDIVKLKSIALFRRQKSRDLFDMAILLERGLTSVDELQRIYAFTKHKDGLLREYIEQFHIKSEEEDDTSLDFLPEHAHYKTFVKLDQDARFLLCKSMFLEQLDAQLKEKLKTKQQTVRAGLKEKKDK